MSTTTTFDLRAAVQDRARARREEQRAHEATREAAAEAARQGLINDFRQRVESHLSPALREQLGELTYAIHQVQYSAAPTARFTIDGVSYTLAPSDHGTKLGIFPYARDRHLTVLYATPGTKLADTALIDYLAGVHLDLVTEAREREQSEQEQHLAYEQAIAEDARCRERVEAARADAEARRWRWPAGVKLRLYRWRWATAEKDFWSREPALYSDGTSTGWLHTHDGRRFNLAMMNPGPEVEELWFASVKELPRELRQDFTFTVPGVAMSSLLTEAGYLFEESSDLEQYHTVRYSEAEPIDWVKAIFTS